MSDLHSALVHMSRLLGSVPHAVCGGLAVSAHGHARFTRDCDFVVDVESDAEAEALIGRMLRRGLGLSALLEGKEDGRIWTVRLRAPPKVAATEPIVDLIFASTGIEAELVERAVVLPYMDSGIRTVSVGSLLAMKTLSYDDDRRPHDRQDMNNLLVGATATDLEETRELLELVHHRGFARNKDLHTRLDDVLRKVRPDLLG